MLKAILMIVFGYLVGAIPTGVLAGKLLRGVDIRTIGSGNVGATNVYRLLGFKAAIFVLLFDVAKGAGVVYIVNLLADYQFFPFPKEGVEFLKILAGLAAITGHTFTIFLRFKGGKGVATSAGVFIGLAPLPMMVIIPTFFLIAVLTRFVSVGSIVGAFLLPLLMCLLKQGPIVTLFGGVVAILIIIKHIPNIRRLLAGTEYSFGETTEIL
jgi:glycerol-3-phosphate acyltransferase PlsY